MSTQPQRFTATDIARRTGTDRFSARRAVSGVTPSSKVTREGNKADAWHKMDLPPKVRAQVDPLTLLDFADMLAGCVDRWRDKRNPTREQQETFFDACLLHLDRLVASGAALEPLRDFVFNWIAGNVAPGALAATDGALKKKFARCLKRWRQCGGKPGCLRAQWAQAAKARRAPALPGDDFELILGTALETQKNGSLRGAWYFAWDNLSEATKTRYKDKHSVPKKVQQVLLPEIRALWDWYHRPRYARLNGASVRLDHSFFFAGDMFSADDLTLEVYYYVPDGAGWFTLIRGQFIPLIDVRSKKILDFILIDERSYTAVDIRRLITRVCERHGIPRVGFHFENSIWASKMVSGGARVDPYDDRKETFADRIGIRIITALPGNARAKVIENVNGLFQRFMPGEFGYVGPDEMKIKFERVQKAKQMVERGSKSRIHPSEAGFLSSDEWYQRLHEICDAYNAKPQDSRVMGGNKVVRMSPNEAWEQLQPRSETGLVVPMDPVTTANRHLLACHKEIKTVTKNGVEIDGKRYLDASIPLRGENVIVWYDPDQPQAIIVTDEHGENMRTVTKTKEPRAFVGTSEEISEAQSQIGQVNQRNKGRVSELKKKFDAPKRKVIPDGQTQRFVRNMESQKAGLQQAEEEGRRRQKEARNLQNRMGDGVDPDAFASLPAEVQRVMEEAMEDDE